MSGISMSTALEIFTNPKDLEIVVSREKNGDKYAFLITRGPGHNFKMILSSNPFTENFEEVLKAIRETLEKIQQKMTEEFEDSKSLVSRYLRSSDEPLDQSKILSNSLINQIMDNLRENQITSTYTTK